MTQRSNEEVGELVKARRLELRMAPNEVTAAASVDPKTYASLEDGSRWPQERSRLRIEAALHWAPGSIAALQDGGEATALRSVQSTATGSGTVTAEVQAAPAAPDLDRWVALSFLADEVDAAASLSTPSSDADEDEIEDFIGQVETLVSAAEELTDSVHDMVLDGFDGDLAKLRQMKRDVRRTNLAKAGYIKPPTIPEDEGELVEFPFAARIEDDPKEDPDE